MHAKKETVVVSIGGSILLSSEPARTVAGLARLLRSLSSRIKLFVVVGGGKTSRFYIELGRALGMDEDALDWLGIRVTRLNASVLAAALGRKTNQRPAETVGEAARLSRRFPIVVMGGTTPGHTTDAVAAMLARKVKAARVVNATSVDGVYTSDPRSDRKARRLERLGYAELIKLTEGYRGFAGPSVVFDNLGARTLARSGIPLLVVDGRDPRALGGAIKGKRFHGTVVS